MFTPDFLIRTGLALVASIGAAAHAAEPQESVTPDVPPFVLNEHRTANFQPIVAPRTLAAPISSERSVALPLRPAVSPARELVLPWIRSAEARHELPAGLLDAVIATESAYLPFAVSRAGAAGLAQLMPGTAADLGVSNRFDPVQSIEGGARYLRQMLDRFGTISLALAAYKAGPGAVIQAKGIPPNRETPGYVTGVISRWLSREHRP